MRRILFPKEVILKTLGKVLSDIYGKQAPADIAALKTEKESEINEFTLKCGEKVDIRRFEIVETDGVLAATIMEARLVFWSRLPQEPMSN